MKIHFPKSIASTLLTWFLFIAIVPLLGVAWYAYDNAVLDMETMQRHKLEDTSLANVEYINNWFDQTYKNLDSWSQNEPTQAYLHILETKFQQSGKTLHDFTRSKEYQKLLEIHDDHMVRIAERYDYVYDLFLIDLKGNILSTIAKEPDLGTNLLNGPYQYTRFAQSYRATLGDKKAHFSDLEYYAPSNGAISGFICLPMHGSAGEIVGIMAMQLNLNSMVKKFSSSSSMKHYLVGYEGLLRTPIENEQEILKRRVSSVQFWHWYNEHGLFGVYPTDMPEEAIVYQGPSGQKVLGQHHAIEFLGVKWVQITEVDESTLHIAPNELAQKIGFIMLLSILAIGAVAMSIARRITRPIQQLNASALAYVAGNKDTKLELTEDNEVGELTTSFQRMMDVQKADEAHLQELLDSLEEQKYALDAHSIVAITDIKGTITFVNQKFEEISGYTYEELIGQNHRILNSGMQPKSYWKSMFDDVTHGNVWHDIVCNKAKDGHLYWVDTTIVPFMGKDGKPQSYIAIRTDVTKRKLAEDAMNKALNIQKAIFDNAGVSIIVTDTSGIITAMNLAAENMVGYSSEELVGKQTPAIIHKIDEVVTRAKEVSDELGEIVEPGFRVFVAKSDYNLPNSAEWTYVRKDKTEFSVYLTITALRDVNEVIYGYMGIASDISVLKEAETQLLEAKNIAEDSARSKSEFLAAMSHEIRTPMNGVLGMLGLLEQSQLDNTQRHRVHVAQSSATSLLGLINDILDFSKIEAGKMDLENIEFNLRDELGEFAEAIAFRAQEKGLELILDTTQVHVQNIITDPGRLRQIMTNLVGNAVKFTHQGHILIRVSIENIDAENVRLLIDITDSGIGIPPEKIGTLFEAFTQADGSTTRKYGGTGLGLSIVKRLCELMGGTVYATSIPNQGSTFSVEVNIGLGTNHDMVIPSVSVEGKTVLIIDDNEVNRAVVRAQLEQWGMIAAEAQDAMSAFDMCQVQISQGHIPPYDVALVDMQMPDMDGAQLGREIRKISGCDEMKMVMMTSLGSRHDAKIFADLGFNAFFAKPTTAKDLLNALKVLFEDGEVLRSVEPLLTKDYLGTLKDEQSEILWPASTRILLVEDNTTNQLVAQGMLESIGLRADIAANGLEALESLQLAQEESVPYTFVLMDCQMPEMDGYTASSAIRAGKAGSANTKIPIIAMTANAMSGDREKCILSGMDDYISKPINLSVLKATIVKWLFNGGSVPMDTASVAEIVPIEEVIVPLLDLPLWDESDALKRLGNNAALLNKIIESFMNDGPKSLSALGTALDEDNSSNAQLHAHSLKGSAGNVGALKLQNIAKHLEEAAKNNNLQEVRAAYDECEHVLGETLTIFEAHLAKEVKPTVKKKRLDALQMAIKLQSLEKEIEAGAFIDTEAVGIFVEYTDEVFTTNMAKLKGHINAFESEEALLTLKSIMAGL